MAEPSSRHKRHHDARFDPAEKDGADDVTSVTLELRRECDEGLGMVLGVEETHDVRSGRSVVVKSVTPGGAAARAEAVLQSDVTQKVRKEDLSNVQQGFCVNDRVLQIDDMVLDDLDDDDCLTVLQEIPENCTIIVQRTLSPRASPRSGTSTSSAANLSTLPMTSSPLSGTAPSSGKERPQKPTSSKPSPRPPPRKVRRQKSTAAHLAEKGLPGFLVRRVTIRRSEGQSLGLSIVPSFGATKFYYQVKRLLPSGVCAKTEGLHIGDRLLECNGHSLQNLTQAQCLDVLKAAGPRVTLTLLHKVEDREEETDAADAKSSRSPRVERIEEDGAGEVGVKRKEEVGGKKAGAEINGDGDRGSVSLTTGGGGEVEIITAAGTVSQTVPSSSPNDVTVTEPLTPDDRPASEITEDTTGPDTATMSNPFLDPPPCTEGEGSALDEPQQHNGNSSAVQSMSKTNPFYEDLLNASNFSNQPCAQQQSDPQTDTLIDFASGLNAQGDTPGDGLLLTEDILLDVSDVGTGAPSAYTVQANGGVDLLGSNDAQFGESDVNIPPPMEFSDFGNPAFSEPPKTTQGSPVTNIDDLLGMEFSASVDTTETEFRGEGGASDSFNTSNGDSDNGFDLLLDAEEARQQAAAAPALLADIDEEEPPQLPSQPPPTIPSEPPPPVPSEPPPPVPMDSFPGDEFGSGADVEADVTTSVFLPSANPSDNVTLISVSPETPLTRSDGGSSENTVHVTDITVTSPTSNVSAVDVNKPKPAPRGRETNKDSKTLPGSAVVTVDSGSSTVNATQIQFDNSTKETVIKSTLPPNAFMPTSVGITKAVKPNSPRTQEVGEEEEEQITPMMVHRDHQGNKMAAPSPPETLGRQSNGPRKVDEEAKRELHTILSRMTENTRGLPVLQNGSGDKDAPTVSEDEIVPVKLTRKETETAQEVLSKWMSEDPKSSPANPFPSSVKKTGFQKAVGTVIDVQSGKVQMPSNSVFLTTMGVSQTPQARENGVSEEVEEEITPMTLHKDHLGNKHYAPSPPESLGKQAGLRKLDSAAKEDMASLMSGMASKTKHAKTTATDTDADNVLEEEIVATVLSKEESRVAMETVTKWLSGESDDSKAKPSPFQRLVGSVIDSAAKTYSEDREEKKKLPDQVSEASDKTDAPVTEQIEEIAIQRSQAAPISSAPTPTAKPVAPEVSQEQATLPKQPPPEVKPKPAMAERKTLFEQPEHSQVTKTETKPLSTRIEIGTKSTSITSTKADPKPVPTQRSLLAPARIGSLSQTSSLSTKPLSKIGTLSVTNRGTIPSLSASKLSSASKMEYGKTRNDETPFLVEVLKGIVGLGIKVKVNGEGHVEVTDVQKNSPVDKNGNIKVGDYVLCINTTELRSLTEGRVQQVLRLLPRGLIKLVVSTQPPSSSAAQGSDSSGQSSPRGGGAYSQYGVRLSAQPFSPTSSDGQPPSLTSPVSQLAEETPPPSSPPVTKPLTVSVGDKEQENQEDEDEMASRKLSKALSPRSSAQQTYHPEPPSPPKPTPRQRASVPTSLTPRSDISSDEAPDPGQMSPRKAERKMTASEIVAAASRRPSGRDGDLPQPPPMSPKGEAVHKEQEESSNSSPRHSSSVVDPAVAAAKSPSDVESPREEVLPVFAEAAKKVSPVPTPRPKPGSPLEDNHDHSDRKRSSSVNSEDHTKREPAVKPEAADKKPEADEVVVHAHAVTISHSAPPPAVASKPKIPPPVAPKPKRTSSIGSDKSSSSVLSDETPKDLPSPTLVSSKLRDFADASAPTVEDQAQSRKFVSSAARMFERKATETKPVSPLTQPTRSSVPVSSVVKSFNRDPEPEPSGRSGVTMRKISLGTSSARGDGGKHINSALLPPSERRKSMPVSGTSSSLQLTKPSSLSQFRNTSSVRHSLSKFEEVEAESDRSPRFNSALKPRHSSSNTTSLRSVIATREHKEEAQPASPPTVGKNTDSRVSDTQSDVTYRSRPSMHDSHGVSSHSKHASWSPQTDDPHSPKMIFTSSSLHHSPKCISSPTSPPAVPSKRGQSDNLESTMKKFDDLLSDKLTFDSDEELPKVSNSVSLDLLKSKNAGKVAASMKSEEPAAAPSQESPASSSVASKEDHVHAEKSPTGGHAEKSEVPTERKDQEPASVTEDATQSKESTETAEPTAEQAQPDAEIVHASVIQTVESVPIREEPTAEQPQPNEEIVHATVIQTVESAPVREEPPKPSEQQEEPAETERLEQIRQQIQSLPSTDLKEEEAKPICQEAAVKVVVDTQQESPASLPVISDSVKIKDSSEEKRADAASAERMQEKERDAESEGEEMDAYPEEDAAAAMDMPLMEDAYPEEDAAAPADTATEALFQQQASTIVQTVLSKALIDIANDPKQEDEEDEDSAPPPLPDEEPPPLPGAPPPPLCLRDNVEPLVDAEDLEGMLPSQDASARSSPRSSEGLASSAEASPRVDTSRTEVIESDVVELEIDEAIKAETSAQNFTVPMQQHFSEEELVPQNNEPHPVTDSDVLISFDSPSSKSIDLSVDTQLLGNGLPGKDTDLEHAHSENLPVSDTLSQDSGVQDEDMSEDGLRFSQDDSPTSNVDSSMLDTAMTPDEIPASVMSGQEEGKPAVEVGVESVTVTKSPVPSPRRTVSRTSPTAPTSHDPSPAVKDSTSSRDVQNSDDSFPQDSSSPRCSSEPRETEVSALPGGVSTTGDGAGDEQVTDDCARVTAARDSAEKDHVQSKDNGEEPEADVTQIPETHNVEIVDNNSSKTSSDDAPKPPESAPPPLPTPDIDRPEALKDSPEALNQEADVSSDSVEVIGSRKWCILDQSGSLFLHGASNQAVSVAKTTLRQVSSMHPGDFVSMLAEGNRDLDTAKLPKTVELRVVSARGLNGRAVNVDVTQREDYFVQVTKVLTKDSSLHEADLLLSVDGRTMKNRRPAKVHAELDSTGPKGVLLTARGVKLPSSVARQLEERSQEGEPSFPDTQPPPTSSSPTPSTPTSLTPAVQVAPGVYDVTMVKGATGVGFCLEGGKASPKGDLPILIKRIFKGGPAEKCGQLKVKDEILSVNGIDFTTMRHYEAWNHLKFLDDGEIRLRIKRAES